MKPSVIVALLLGLGLGFVVGKTFSAPGSTSASSSSSARANPSAPQAAANPETMPVFKVPIDGSYATGSDSALITLVEFSDYQCPYCIQASAKVKALEEQFGSKLRVVMKHNPLSFHEHAKPSALAALAAGEQGKFWQFHDALFAKKGALSESDLEGIAKDLDLDMDKWQASRKDPKHEDRIRKDQALAAQVGANGTPGFFINGRFIGNPSVETFKAVAEFEQKRAEAAIAQGTPANQVYAKMISTGQDKVNRPAPQAPPTPAAEYRNAVFPADAPSFGPKDAKVTIVEYSDFQCPFCARGANTVKQIKEEFPDVRFVFLHNPLPMHRNAPLAAEASMAANEQGKFWEFHDKLFANQSALERASLEKYAEELGLNMAKFKSALDTGKFKARVQADANSAAEIEAASTPNFFVNGRLIEGAYPIDTFRTVIAEEKARAEKVLASGVKPVNLYAELLKSTPKAQAIEIDTAGLPYKGGKDAKVTVVEFSDFQCPYCARATAIVKQIEEKYGDKVKVVFKQFPLESIHPNARPAAEAAMAAHEQGKFWQMHDKLFANQQALSPATYEQYAKEIGLDMNKFKASLDSKSASQKVAKDAADAMKIGVNATPSFYVNGAAVKNPGRLMAQIDRALAEAGTKTAQPAALKK